MAASGVPTPQEDHIDRAFKFATAIIRRVDKINEMLDTPLQLRIGIHCGPLMAGVIGSKKSIYDLWGDTVNTASRLENTGIPNCIQVSQPIYERMHKQFPLSHRGTILLKGKGEIQTYIISLDDLNCVSLPMDRLIKTS